MKMNIYLISQDQNDDYDTYDSAVVIAKDEHAARLTKPGGVRAGEVWNGTVSQYSSWTDAKNVTVELIGVSDSYEPSVVCESFNAG
jgi:hypothetical protein